MRHRRGVLPGSQVLKCRCALYCGYPCKLSRAKLRQALSLAAAEFLNRAPIYQLRPTDIKKAAARLILQDVKVLDRKLIVSMGVG